MNIVAANILTIIIGVIVILITGDFTINYCNRIGKHFRLSDAFLGMTILAIGTSFPEIIMHIVGSIKILKDPSLYTNMSNLLVGSNIGSDIFQQNFLLSMVAFFNTFMISPGSEDLPHF